MQATAGGGRQWLGHATEHHAVPLSHRVRRHFEENETIGRSQRFVKAVIDLVLAAGVLMVDLLQLKAERRQILAHVVQKIAVAVDGLQVIGRLVQPVLAVGRLPAAVARRLE